MYELHARVRTKSRTQAEIKDSQVSLVALPEIYSINMVTARKYKRRECPQNLLHRLNSLSTRQTPRQKSITVELRRLTLLPLDDDQVAVVSEYLLPLHFTPRVGSVRT